MYKIIINKICIYVHDISPYQIFMLLYLHFINYNYETESLIRAVAILIFLTKKRDLIKLHRAQSLKMSTQTFSLDINKLSSQKFAKILFIFSVAGN
jgi:hypothetical protein